VPIESGSAAVLGGLRPKRLLRDALGIETWLADDPAGGGEAVVKVLDAGALPASVRQRLAQDAAALRAPGSPHIAPALGFGVAEGRLYLAFRFVPGETLEERLRLGRLAVGEALAVGRALLAALRAAHGRGVLHRDVKPSNLVLRDGGGRIEGAVLTDFGLPRHGRHGGSLRALPAASLRYLSPEQSGLVPRDVDARADLYAAGAVLFECLAGRPAFAGETPGEVLRRHLTDRPPGLRSLGVAAPRALDDLLARLLAKDPRDRYQSAEAALLDLADIADAMGRGEADPRVAIGARDRRPSLAEPAFIGRADELAALDLEIGRARGGRGRAVLLEAESGGGKTRLLDELALRAAGAGFHVLRGRAADERARRPLEVLDGVVREIVEAALADRGFAEQLRAGLGDHAAAAAAALPELGPLLAGEGRVPEAAGPEAHGEERALSGLAALLAALGSAGRPAAILLDDCQWADELTLKLLARFAADRAAPGASPGHVALVLAFRAEEVGPAHPLRALAGAGRVALSPFKPEDVRRLAESMAGALPDAVHALIARLSEGSPFIAAAVLQGLVEQGALVPGRAGWRVEEAALAEARSSHEAAPFLVRRLDRLPADVLHVLGAGAVLGREFDLDLAAGLAGRTPAAALGAADEARRRHLLWADPRGSRFAFAHDKLREAVLARMGEAERRRLHAAAARRHAVEGRDRALEVAYHVAALCTRRRGALPGAADARARRAPLPHRRGGRARGGPREAARGRPRARGRPHAPRPL
jgi:hypothetical protein